MDKMLLLNELSKSGFYDHGKVYHRLDTTIIHVTRDRIESLLTILGVFVTIPDVVDNYSAGQTGRGIVGSFIIAPGGKVSLESSSINNIRELMERRETESHNGPDAINLLKIRMWGEGMVQANVFIKQHLEEIVRKLSSLEGIE